ncbi:MAG: response regulator [Myxococcales bacterium]|nr:response regulator [Myxococcales bacterium]
MSIKVQEEDTLLNLRRPDKRGDNVERQACLVIIAGPRAGRKVPISGPTTIGRSATCTLQIDHRGVSRRHAQLIQAGDGHYEIQDLDSRNGTAVNGETADHRALEDGDRIQLGPRVTLLFTLKDPMEEHLHEAQKMEAIGRLSAGITHDFNNLLSVLSANLDFIKGMRGETCLSDPDIQECLAELDTATARATELTGRLAGFVRRGDDVHRPVNISELCKEVIRLVRRLLPSRINVQTHIQPSLVVDGSRPQLHQMLMNPCINARDAMPDGGELLIRAAIMSHGELSDLPLTSDEPHVVITVEDSGVGMDEETLKRAFDPFFTTKGRQLGTGLGLATVRTIAKEHGGHAEVESVEGLGTTVRIYVPASEARAEGSLATIDLEPTAPLLQGNASILVVDDERDVARSAGRLLERTGYKVTYAVDGVEALDLFTQGERPPDLVLLDIDMPRMGGRECFRHMRRIHPDVRVLFISGQWAERDEKVLRREGARGLLRKPLVDKRLQAAVVAALT